MMQPTFRVKVNPWHNLKKTLGLLMLSIAMCGFGEDLGSPSGVSGYAYQASGQAQLTFTMNGGVSGRSPGARFSLETYISSDGVSVSSRLDRYGSSSRAHKELIKTLRSLKVIERKPKFDAAGHPVGERVVVESRSKKSPRAFAAVLWTDNTELHRIQSLSLKHVLEFEKKFYP